jgi:hypothetical protein
MATAYRSQVSGTATNTNRAYIPEHFVKSYLKKAVKNACFHWLVSNTFQEKFNDYGDTIVIPKLTGNPAWAAYTPNSTSITYSALSEDFDRLNVDQVYYYAFGEDYVDTQLSAVHVPAAHVEWRAAQLMVQQDTFLQTTMAAGVDLSLTIGTSTNPIPVSPENIRAIFAEAERLLGNSGGTNLNDGEMPFAAISYNVNSKLQFMPEFAHATVAGDSRLSTGKWVQPFHGFELKKTNNIVTTDGAPPVETILFGYKAATEFVKNIYIPDEEVKLHSAFATGYRGLSMWGAEVVYPEALVKAYVTVQG